MYIYIYASFTYIHIVIFVCSDGPAPCRANSWRRQKESGRSKAAPSEHLAMVNVYTDSMCMCIYMCIYIYICIYTYIYIHT